MRNVKVVIIAAVAVALLVQSRAATAKEMPESKFKIERVALFKNGLGFFAGQVHCPADEKCFVFRPLGVASHGTFWVGCSAGADLRSLTAREVKLVEKTDAVSIAELLKANVGRKLTVKIGDEHISGVLKYYPDARMPENPNAYDFGVRQVPDPRQRGWNDNRSQLYIIATDDGDLAYNPLSINGMCFSFYFYLFFFHSSKNYQ